MEYKKVKNALGQDSDKLIRRESDKALIPIDIKNKDYREYQAWLANGNVPEEAD